MFNLPRNLGTPVARTAMAVVAMAGCILPSGPALAAKASAKLDEMSLDRWALLGEADRYQMNVAEKMYRDRDWAGAAGEYEKFLSLYERSEGAPFAQLKWSMCQIHLKKLNTAIKDGFQSVIDYWPESPEAVAAALLIGRTYKDMGDLTPARKAYEIVRTKYPDEVVSVLAKVDLADIARIEMDRPRRVTLLKDLTFNSPRLGDALRLCQEASRQLATLQFEDGAFIDGKDALATTYKAPDLFYQVLQHVREPISRLVSVADTKERGLKLAAAAISYFRQQAPAAAKDDTEKNLAQLLAFDVADVHMAAGQIVEAGKVYQDLLQSTGNEDSVLLHYAQWLKVQNRRDEARQVYARMKNQVEGQSQIAYSYREENKHLLAAPIYQELITRDTERAQQWQWSLAEAYREGGKWQEAIAAFQQCNNYPTNLHRMALCYRHLKQTKEAIGMYMQIMGAYESSAPDALLQIGYTQEQAGQTETAIKTFQQVCKRYPTTGEASQAHAHLQNKYKISVTLGGAKEK